MALFAISDLHLALNGDKPMDVFGDRWLSHDKKIEANWRAMVKEEDTVLIGGDISWAMSMKESEVDLNWIENLPGSKIIIKGNHDYWWGSITKLNSMYSSISFIQNNFFTYKDYAICGTRGWICQGSDNFKEEDKKIYDRELNRLQLSLDSAVKAGYKKIVGMIHYPPTNEKFQNSGFTDIFEMYKVEKVIYGHLHGPFYYQVLNGLRNSVEYMLTSCDYIKFSPIKILD